jgi:hypothetical protein
LHYTRRIYDHKFVPNTKLPPATASFNPEDSIQKLVPAPAGSQEGSDQVTPLAARLFATWTLLTSIVRLYAAYNLGNGAFYNVAIGTYAVAFGHFSSELFFFKSMSFGLPQFFPFAFSTIALIWMPMVRSSYVQ